MLEYLSLNVICSSKLTESFTEVRSWKTVRFSEQIMSADKYPSIFSRQMKAIVYIEHIYTLDLGIGRLEDLGNGKNSIIRIIISMCYYWTYICYRSKLFIGYLPQTDLV